MDEALDAVFLCLLEKVAGADNIGCINIFWRVEGEGSGCVDDNVRASHAFTDRFLVANVALKEGNLIPFGVGEIDQVNT